MKGRGRPTGMTPVLVEGLKECMKKGMTIEQTAKILGRGKSTVARWKKILESDEAILVDLSDQKKIDELNQKFLKNVRVDSFGLAKKDLVNLCQSQYDQVDNAWIFSNLGIKPTDIPVSIRA